jgi:hypothetical protein
MRCNHCNTRLANHDIWCLNCHRQSGLVKHELSALQSLKRTWDAFAPSRGMNVPLAVPAIILGLIPIAILVWLLNTNLILSTGTALQLVLSLVIKSLVFSIFIPFVLIGFSAVSSQPGYQAGKAALPLSFRSYPRYLMFSLMNCLYYVIIYLICFGFPGFGSDPILRLVWIVLVNYWIALVLPVPVLMERRELGFWEALKLSYRHFHVVRWNIYLMVLILFAINSIAGLLFILPLAITLPFSWFAIRDYTDLLLEYELDRQ